MCSGCWRSRMAILHARRPCPVSLRSSVGSSSFSRPPPDALANLQCLIIRTATARKPSRVSCARSPAVHLRDHGPADPAATRRPTRLRAPYLESRNRLTVGSGSSWSSPRHRACPPRRRSGRGVGDRLVRGAVHGRWPEGLRSFGRGVMRWGTRSAPISLLTDKYPPSLGERRVPVGGIRPVKLGAPAQEVRARRFRSIDGWTRHGPTTSECAFVLTGIRGLKLSTRGLKASMIGPGIRPRFANRIIAIPTHSHIAHCAVSGLRGPRDGTSSTAVLLGAACLSRLRYFTATRSQPPPSPSHIEVGLA